MIVSTNESIRAVLEGREPVENTLEWCTVGKRTTEEIARYCPIGRPGDVLACKESYVLYQMVAHIKHKDGRAFSEILDGQCAYKAYGYGSVKDFIAHCKLICGIEIEDVFVNANNWRSPVTMPRWAIHHFFAIKEVEALHAINQWVWYVEVEEVKP